MVTKKQTKKQIADIDGIKIYSGVPCPGGETAGIDFDAIVRALKVGHMAECSEKQAKALDNAARKAKMSLKICKLPGGMFGVWRIRKRETKPRRPANGKIRRARKASKAKPVVKDPGPPPPGVADGTVGAGEQTVRL